MLLKQSRLEKLKQLRLAKQSGKVLDVSDAEEENGIYDEVDEDTYREHKRNQMMNDDFIVDDDGEGYVDNGVDEWDERTRPNYYSDDDNEDIGGKKRKRKDKKPQKVTKTSKINNFFKPKGFDISSNKKPSIKIDANVDDILNEFDSKPQKPRFGMFGKANTIATASTVSQSDNVVIDLDSDIIIDQPSSPIKREEVTPLQLVGVPSFEVDDDSEDDDIIVAKRPRVSAVNRATVATVSTARTISSSTTVSLPQTTSNPNIVSSPNTSVSYTDKLDKEQITSEETFKMFWFDHCEVDGALILFGKVQTKQGLVSGAIQINGLARELYFLPRKFRKVEENEEDENDPVTPMDVHQEIVPLLLEQYKLDNIRAKPQVMKYAFELAGIPKQAEYLKVLLPYKTPKNRHKIIPGNLEGETFSHVFGGNTGIFESFVIQRNIMGPCWIEVSKGDFSSFQNSCHCQVEVAVGSPNNIKVISDKNLKSPDLTITSIAVHTVMNTKLNKQEVAAVSLSTYRDLPHESPIDENLQPNETVTLVRPVNASSFPPGLNQYAQKQGLNIRTFPNEKALLNCFSAIVRQQDPDVFIGHRLENISLDVLVHRMYDLKVTTWSNLGRRNRKVWPDRFGKSTNNLQLREIFHGRLLCDIANELGQSLTPKCQSWDLNEMYDVVCHKQHPTLEANYNNPQYFEDANVLLMALKDCVMSSKISAEIAFAIQILSLSKQLTNLAGNAWSQTLFGTRAGRNEYILLHEFHRNDYICPDKEDKFHKNTNYNIDAEDESNATSNKKPKYQGGLVFEPEKGLHKNYVLVMDFNSLYPSIIQEFNICFTTVERDAYNVSHDEEKDLPNLPELNSVPGVLPKLLNTLVTRRREVKKLLKDPKSTAVERTQYDIKQQALKLTANSMYGCLGYVNSRFYAKPLAMLVTNKGREILRNTRDVAESLGLRVIYGDTDSVMVDTGVMDLQQAYEIGNNFKTQINERYKLLELDIDNVFKRILLHAKKKYAAMDATIDRKTGQEIHKLEVKGLDMKRREYCQLSKDISTFILNKILKDADIEQALTDIYEYLEIMSGKIKNNEIPADKYKINTKLSKDPANYPNGKTMAPVQVALRLRDQGKVIKAGSFISYVITAPVDQDDKSTQAERARAFQEVMNKNLGYKPDPNYYLEKQIFAPVERLLERIDGIDMVRVATSLSIDTKKYILRVKNGDYANGLVPLESNISDAERFRQASHLLLTCKCGHKFRFGGIQASKDYKISANGIVCKCNQAFTPLKVNCQLEAAIRKHIATYYAGWLVCDDQACGITTRQISVYGKRCISNSGKAYGCKGIMRYKYSDKALYSQLLYFEALFDVDKAKGFKLKPLDDGTEPLPSGRVEALAEQNRQLFNGTKEIVKQYLNNCGRRYVDMASIFDFMIA